jgi:hypothetical protein
MGILELSEKEVESRVDFSLTRYAHCAAFFILRMKVNWQFSGSHLEEGGGRESSFLI